MLEQMKHTLIDMNIIKNKSFFKSVGIRLHRQRFVTPATRDDKRCIGLLTVGFVDQSSSGLSAGLDVFNLWALITLLKVLRSPAA